MIRPGHTSTANFRKSALKNNSSKSTVALLWHGAIAESCEG